MGKINILTDDLKNKIAAGEVVERPASVVKELIENSIDAGASEIEVSVNGGGNAFIQVRDNGEGLDRDDLILAFSRYATSKIGSGEDLYHIATLGFRGEALASIASVATVKAVSTVDGGETANEIVASDGNVGTPTPGVISMGTSVSVTDLFFSVPGRRKFLKSSQVELRHVIDTVRRFALGYPHVSFRFVADGKEVLNLQPDSLKERIGKVFDPSYKQNLLEIAYEKGPYRIAGYAGNLNLVRRRRGEQFLFLRGRYISDKLLNSAVYSSYQSLVSRGEFPFFALNLEVPRDEVDVNVHPMKIEVRFRDEWRIYHAVKSGVTEALSEILKTIPDFVPFEKRFEGRGKSKQDSLPLQRGGPTGRSAVEMETVERAKEYIRAFSTRAIESESMNLENIWQVHSKYIISEIKSGLVLIDQHVAHERVLFEQALKALEEEPMPSQTLLFPEVVDLPADEFSTLVDLFPYLEKIGFRMKEFGKNTVMIEGVPSEMTWGNVKEVLKNILDSYESEQKKQASFQEAFAASFACRAAVRAGDSLTKEEMQSLVDRLFATKHPYYCPHGRPIIVNLTLDELDRRFERS